MGEVLEARREYKQAERDALELRARARARLGRAVAEERQKNHSSQETIARKLGVVKEQVRRYEQAYNDWLEDHPGESLD